MLRWVESEIFFITSGPGEAAQYVLSHGLWRSLDH